MLASWLAPTTMAEFTAQHLRRAPLARPSTARAAVELFGWDTLARVMSAPAVDALIVRGGVDVDEPLPTTSAAIRALLDRSLGLVVRRAERVDAELAALARSFASDLPGEAHVQLFVTPGGTNGFGWHYDAEEVFIAQTAGTKTYYFRANTIDPEPTPGAQPDFGRVRDETTPMLACTMEPGDWLYLPRGTWHVAKAVRDSLSISIGVLPTSAPE